MIGILQLHIHCHHFLCPIAFIRRFARFDSFFILLGFATEFFLQHKVISLVPNPQPGGPSTCIYVTFYDSQGYGGGIRTHLYMLMYVHIMIENTQNDISSFGLLSVGRTVNFRGQILSFN